LNSPALRRAAEITGRGVSDFVVAAAQDAARRTIEDSQLIRLSVEDQRLFVDALLNPPRPNDALSRAATSFRDRLASSLSAPLTPSSAS
jgi:uncharacterized protein (DUF1778 family)